MSLPRQCLIRGKAVEVRPTFRNEDHPLSRNRLVVHEGGYARTVLASRVDHVPADDSRPPVINGSAPGVQLWFDYSTPLMAMHDGLCIEAYGIPKGNNCTQGCEIQGVITVE